MRICLWIGNENRSGSWSCELTCSTHCTTLRYDILYYTIVYYNILYYVPYTIYYIIYTLYAILYTLYTIHYTILHYIILYCTLMYYMHVSRNVPAGFGSGRL